MTMTTAVDCPNDARFVRRARPRGFDRAVMLVSVAMLRWARRRADRMTISSQEHARLLAIATATQRREHHAALIAARAR